MRQLAFWALGLALFAGTGAGSYQFYVNSGSFRAATARHEAPRPAAQRADLDVVNGLMYHLQRYQGKDAE